MTKYLYIIFFLILTACSFDTRSGIWTQEKKINQLVKKTTKLFDNKILDEKEFNQNLNIKLSNNYLNINKVNGNNGGISDLKLNFDKISKYKFSKIKYFDLFEPEIIFYKDNLIFFDNKGTIIRFGDKSEILWKKNFYNKKEKKNNPILSFSYDNNRLLVTDSLSKFYLINVENGELLWLKEHQSNFISQIKIDKDKFYVLDSENTFICFSLKDGEVLWRFKTDKQLIKSQKKTSVIFDENFVYFNNSKGEIISLQKRNGNLAWITPSIGFDESFQSFLLKTSDLVVNNGSIYFSNNKNKFHSIDANTGFINWIREINSYVRPIIVDNIIFTISTNGYLYIIEKNTGDIIRITDIVQNSKKRKKIKISGFVVGVENIYISLNNGKLIVVSIKTGREKLVYKITKGLISRPYVNNKNLYVVKDNEIIRLN